MLAGSRRIIVSQERESQPPRIHDPFRKLLGSGSLRATSDVQISLKHVVYVFSVTSFTKKVLVSGLPHSGTRTYLPKGTSQRPLPYSKVAPDTSSTQHLHHSAVNRRKKARAMGHEPCAKINLILVLRNYGRAIVVTCKTSALCGQTVCSSVPCLWQSSRSKAQRAK